jgi:hypothetical protein
MKEDAYVEKVFGRWFPRKADAKEAQALVARLRPDGDAAALMQILSDEKQGAGFVERRVGTWLGRIVTDADTKLIEAIARKMKAGTVAVHNAIELREKLHELQQIEGRLKEKEAAAARAAEANRREHEAKMAELDARQAEIEAQRIRAKRTADSPVIASLDEERAKTELAEMKAKQREFERRGQAPPPPPPRPAPTPWWGRVSAAMNQDLRDKQREQMRVDDIAKYLRDKYAPDIALAKSRGDYEAAEALERELNKLLDDLATGEYEP